MCEVALLFEPETYGYQPFWYILYFQWKLTFIDLCTPKLDLLYSGDDCKHSHKMKSSNQLV